jgi:SNF2 family DNA or RNA helicase
MVENQVIAKVLRFGQNRNVRVVRYTMKGTVEQVRDYSFLTIKEAN